MVSVYALFNVSSTFTELGEAKEQVNRMWVSVRIAESRLILQTVKARNLINLVTEGNTSAGASLEKSLADMQGDLARSKRDVLALAKDFNVSIEIGYEKQLAALESQRETTAVLAKKVIQAVRTGSYNGAGNARREFEKSAMEVESMLGKLRATNEILETKVLDVILAKEEASKTKANWLLAVVLFVGLAVSIAVTFSILGPINQIVDRFKDIATGDGDLTKRIRTRSGGELSELAHWMNVFLDRTESIIGTIGNAAEIIGKVTDEVGHHTSQTSVSASGINQSMVEQSLSIEASVHSAENIDDLLQNSNESTRQAATLSRITMDRAVQGGESVHETIAAMEKIEESSVKVEELISSINEIASQTNLLAINAAIEATKAGEHGKGFAVVAEEVRKLAERARRLTAEVTELIDESSNRVKTGVGLAKSAGQGLDNIIKDIESVASLIQRIASAASKQAESSSQLREGMHRVYESVRQNLQDVERVANATDLTAGEVTKLRSLVEQMNSIVGQFRLSEQAAPKEVKPKTPPPPPIFAPLPEGASDIDAGVFTDTQVTNPNLEPDPSLANEAELEAGTFGPAITSEPEEDALAKIVPSKPQTDSVAASLPPPPPLPTLVSNNDGDSGNQEAA